MASRLKSIGLLLLLSLLSSGTCAANDQPLASAYTAYVTGDFATAAREARAIDTSVAAALAARAALAEGDLVAAPQDRRALFVSAEGDARRALERDPENAEGHLCLALALGFLGRIDGSLAAHFAGYAKEARVHIDRALELDPNNAWAHALDGGWNLEIVRDGGIVGETLYDASFDKGINAYRRALELAPDNTAIAYQYALQLLGANGQSNRAEALRVLTHVLKTKSTDAVEIFARRRAKRLKLVLDTHDEFALKNILREGLGAGSAVSDASQSPLPQPGKK